MRLKPSTENGWRVVIIDNADTMNRNAQNALLKVLEEPPARTVLILVAHQMGTFLPTIRSRTHVIPFHPLSDDDFSRVVKSMDYQSRHLTCRGSWPITIANAITLALASAIFTSRLRYR